MGAVTTRKNHCLHQPGAIHLQLALKPTGCSSPAGRATLAGASFPAGGSGFAAQTVIGGVVGGIAGGIAGSEGGKKFGGWVNSLFK